MVRAPTNQLASMSTSSADTDASRKRKVEAIEEDSQKKTSTSTGTGTGSGVAAEASTKGGAGTDPSKWRLVRSNKEEGRSYWYNEASGVSQWGAPEEVQWHMCW